MSHDTPEVRAELIRLKTINSCLVRLRVRVCVYVCVCACVCVCVCVCVFTFPLPSPFSRTLTPPPPQDAFWVYSENSFLFLYKHVAGIIATICLGAGAVSSPTQVSELFTQLVRDCNIMQRVLDAWRMNKGEQARPRGHRKGYMGHLILITTCLRHLQGKYADPLTLVGDAQPQLASDWTRFVTEKLDPIHLVNSMPLVRVCVCACECVWVCG